MTLDHRDNSEWLAQQMLQTNGQAFREDIERLQEILREQPAWVRDTINRFLQEEEARTFQNVVGQIALFRDMLSEIAELVNSEDAVALRNLIKDIHPSNMRGLQREAQSIGEEMEELRLCIGNQDWETMNRLLQRIRRKVQRFRDKFADLRPKLDRLAEKVAELATKCEENANQAEELKQEVEARRDWWFRLFETIAWLTGICSGVGLLGGGIGAIVLHAVLQVKSAALPAAMHAATEASKVAMTKASAAKAAGAASGCAGYAVAGGASGAVAGGAGAAALGAPAATLLGSEALGSLVVSAGLMATPAAPLGMVAGVASAAAAVGTLFGSVIGHASSASAAAAATAASKATAAAATAATANAQVVSLQAVIASLSGWAALCTPFIVFTAVVLALSMLGWLGRDLVKSLLGRLWAAEIQSHEYCARKWRGLENDLRTAAQLLRNSTESCETLETCLDEMFEAAEHACEILEDHNTYTLHPERDLAALTSKVEELCSRYELVIPAFEHFQDQVMILQNHVNLPFEDDEAPSISALSMLENVQADGSSVSMPIQLQVHG